MTDFNPTPIMDIIGKQLEMIPTFENAKYHICAYGGSISIRRANHTSETHCRILERSARLMTEGFNSTDWNLIQAFIYKEFQKGIKCLPHPKR